MGGVVYIRIHIVRSKQRHHITITVRAVVGVCMPYKSVSRELRGNQSTTFQLCMRLTPVETPTTAVVRARPTGCMTDNFGVTDHLRAAWAPNSSTDGYNRIGSRFARAVRLLSFVAIRTPCNSYYPPTSTHSPLLLYVVIVDFIIVNNEYPLLSQSEKKRMEWIGSVDGCGVDRTDTTRTSLFSQAD